MMKFRKTMLTAAVCLICLALALSGCVQKMLDPSKYITLGEYNGIKVTPLSTEVSEEEIDAEILAMLEDFVEYETVVDRALENGDIANIDYTGYIDGIAFDGGSEEAHDLIIGSGSFIGDFEEQLIGMNIGNERSIDVFFPDDYYNQTYAGVKATFEVRLNAIKITIYPELTDEFAKENFEFENIAALRAYLLEALTEEKIANSASQFETDAWVQAVGNATVISLPKDKVDSIYSYMIDYYTSYAEYYGMTLEDFLLMQGMELAQFEIDTKTYAEDSVTEEMVARAIALAEKITATDAEISSLTSYYMQETGCSTAQELYSKYYPKEDIEMAIVYDKVLTFVADNAVAVE